MYLIVSKQQHRDPITQKWSYQKQGS